MGGHTAQVEVSRQELHLLLFIRRLGYGELTVKVQDGVPLFVEKACQKTKLGGEDFEKLKEGVDDHH